MKDIFIIICFVLFSFKMFSQENFIDLHKNNIMAYGKENFKKYNINDLQSDVLNVLHIGDSHIQADMFSSQLRKLINYKLKLYAGRGLIFPYNIAKTHNPDDYNIKYSDVWESNKNADKDKIFDIGITGISVFTKSENAKFSICFKSFDTICVSVKYLKIIHKNSSSQFDILLNKKTSTKIEIIDNNTAVSIFEVNSSDSLNFSFLKNNIEQSEFYIYGIIIEEKQSGIYYHTSGVNGAKVESYLNSNLFFSQLKVLNPKIVIISLGTNNAYSDIFDTSVFIENYQTLINKIKQELPEAELILTTPGDSYKNKKLLNFNNEKVRIIILDIANKNNCFAWDFYTIMGGFRSIDTWFKKGLCIDDKLHFNNNGYILMSNLFFNAFIDTFFEN